MECYVYGRLYWATPEAATPGWRLDLHNTMGGVTKTLEIPASAAPFAPPPVPSPAEAKVCILTTLRWSYDVNMATTIRVEQHGSLPDYHFIATYLYPSQSK
jgi:hypothetical protein